MLELKIVDFNYFLLFSYFHFHLFLIFRLGLGLLLMSHIIITQLHIIKEHYRRFWNKIISYSMVYTY